VLKPVAHIGIEVPNRSDVDALAEKAREIGVLHWEPRYVSETVGYVCALRDPDGNVIEISHDQKVFETVRRLWGAQVLTTPAWQSHRTVRPPKGTVSASCPLRTVPSGQSWPERQLWNQPAPAGAGPTTGLSLPHRTQPRQALLARPFANLANQLAWPLWFAEKLPQYRLCPRGYRLVGIEVCADPQCGFGGFHADHAREQP
jgi:hypothetical protein